MPTLFPPNYPARPDAPLFAFGPAFAEAIARWIIAAFCPPEEDSAAEANIRGAASLTMLEAFHPRNQLECMLAAQGVAAFAGTMDSFDRAMRPGLKPAEIVKFRANAVQMMRAFSTVTHDLERRQVKPLPEPPPTAVPPPPPDADDTPPPRPDGAPADLGAYIRTPPEEPFVPMEPAIMVALATRPKPYRIVNAPQDQAPAPAPPPPAPEPRRSHGLLNGHHHTLNGDPLTRFLSARLDPDAELPPLVSEDEGAEIELEFVSTGDDPDIVAEREAWAAGNPDGKPIRVIRYGRVTPPEDPDDET